MVYYEWCVVADDVMMAVFAVGLPVLSNAASVFLFLRNISMHCMVVCCLQ